MRSFALLLALLLAAPAGADWVRKSGTGYWVDKNSDQIRALDGSEPFFDFTGLEIPGDFATVQLALDSAETNAGDTANQGAHILVGPGTYAQSFEIGGNLNTLWQNSIAIEGVAPAGWENGNSTAVCATTFLGNNTASNVVATVLGSTGWSLRNFCIDMDDAVTNDPAIGIGIGLLDGFSTKHGLLENLTIQSGSSSSIGIKIGSDAPNSDTAFLRIVNVLARDIGTGLVINSQQAVGNLVDGMQCENNKAAIACVQVGNAGGEVELRDVYVGTAVGSPSNQVGISISRWAVGATMIVRPTFEWAGTNGTMIQWANPGLGAGDFRAHTVLGGRFQPQAATGSRYCIDFERIAQLNLIGLSFESGNAAHTCQIRIANPSATLPLEVNVTGIDVQWGSTPSEMIWDFVDAGGGIRINVNDGGKLLTCSPGTSSDVTLTLANAACKGFAPGGAATATTPAANDSSTSVATTAYVQGEINGAGSADLSCSGGVCTVGTAVTRNSQWDTLPEIEAATSKNVIDSTELVPYTVGTSAPVDGTTACNDGDLFLDKTARKLYLCTDGATDKWYGVAMVDTP